MTKKTQHPCKAKNVVLICFGAMTMRISNNFCQGIWETSTILFFKFQLPKDLLRAWPEGHDHHVFMWDWVCGHGIENYI